MSKKRRFGERPPLQKVLIAVVTLASLAIVAFAERARQQVRLATGEPERLRGACLPALRTPLTRHTLPSTT
jgi:hypothetical protein